jgi:hypothetical protein
LFDEYFIALKPTLPEIIFITNFPNFIRVDRSGLFYINRSSDFVDSTITSLVVLEDLSLLIKLEISYDVI